MEACIMICRGERSKAPNRRGQVLFINAINEVERKNAQSFLEDKHIQRIAKAYEAYETEEGFARVVTIQDILRFSRTLSVPLDELMGWNDADPDADIHLLSRSINTSGTSTSPKTQQILRFILDDNDEEDTL